MFIAKSDVYKFESANDGWITFKRLNNLEKISVREAKFIDKATGNVIICKWVDGIFVTKHSYASIRLNESRHRTLCEPSEVLNGNVTNDETA